MTKDRFPADDTQDNQGDSQNTKPTSESLKKWQEFFRTQAGLDAKLVNEEMGGGWN
jgi:hypothetical protein